MIADNLILDAQRAWGEGIVKIGKVFLDNGDYKAAAEEHINEFYNYQEGTVLFKPTLTSEKQFRLANHDKGKRRVSNPQPHSF